MARCFRIVADALWGALATLRFSLQKASHELRRRMLGEQAFGESFARLSGFSA